MADNRSLIEFKRSYTDSTPLRNRIEYQPHSMGEPFVDMYNKTMYIGDNGESGDNRGWPLIPQTLPFSLVNSELTDKIRESLGVFYTYRNGYKLDDNSYIANRFTVQGGMVSLDNVVTSVPDIEIVVQRYPNNANLINHNKIMLFQKPLNNTVIYDNTNVITQLSLIGSVYPNSIGKYAQSTLNSKSIDYLFVDDSGAVSIDWNLRNITSNYLLYIHLSDDNTSLLWDITDDVSKCSDPDIIPVIFVKVLYDKYYNDPSYIDSSGAVVDFSFSKVLYNNGEKFEAVGVQPFKGNITDRDMVKIKHLDISNINVDTTSGLELCANLEYLYASNTNIKNLPELVLNYKSLIMLDLSNNQYLQLANLDLSAMTELVYLNVSDCNAFNTSGDLEEICKHLTLTEDFIRENKDKPGFDWQLISGYQKLSENFIREFQDEVDWECISYNQILSEDFIREFKEYVDWNAIPVRQILSEDFIREFQDNLMSSYGFRAPLKFHEIAQYQKLSEPFIIEFKDKIDWKDISKYQKLTYEFIKQNMNSLNIKFLLENKKLDSNKVKQIYEQYEQFQ